MPTISDIISGYARSVQPLVFETGLDEFPYSTAGTLFLVGFGGRPFAFTTRHGLTPESLSPICIFPSDESRELIPLDDAFYVPESEEPEDYMDLAVIAIDPLRITNAEVAEAPLIALAPTLDGWPEDVAELFLVGFPEDHAFIDQEEQMLHTQRIILNARYVGPSQMPFLHEARVSDTHALSTFSGFSGAPIFGVLRPRDRSPSVGLCGMAIRGSSSSNKIHFLDRSVLIDALNVRCLRGSAA